MSNYEKCTFYISRVGYKMWNDIKLSERSEWT